MTKKEIIHGLIIVTAFVLAVVCGPDVNARQAKSETISFPNLLLMFADQPDHMADRTLVVNDSVIKMKFAKKQGRIRQEFHPLDQADSLKNESYRYYKIITIGKLDQPTMAIDPQERTYAEAPEDFKLVSFDAEALLKRVSAELGSIKAESAGVEVIEGYEANKFKIKFEGSKEEMYFYFAKDMKNLFLKMDSGNIRLLKGSYTVSNVSFDVPDELFEIPKDYKKVDFNSMLSVIREKAVK
jgi:hypothetical protein